MKELIGTCGLFCGACPHFLSSFPSGRHLLKGEREGFTCSGCFSERKYVHEGCSECRIRACAVGKGLRFCFECEKYPCNMLEDFRKDGHRHHLRIYRNLTDIERLGPEEWLEAQKRMWRCPCGKPFSWAEERCNNCGKRVEKG